MNEEKLVETFGKKQNFCLLSKTCLFPTSVFFPNGILSKDLRKIGVWIIHEKEKCVIYFRFSFQFLVRVLMKWRRKEIQGVSYSSNLLAFNTHKMRVLISSFKAGNSKICFELSSQYPRLYGQCFFLLFPIFFDVYQLMTMFLLVHLKTHLQIDRRRRSWILTFLASPLSKPDYHMLPSCYSDRIYVELISDFYCFIDLSKKQTSIHLRMKWINLKNFYFILNLLKMNFPFWRIDSEQIIIWNIRVLFFPCFIKTPADQNRLFTHKRFWSAGICHFEKLNLKIISRKLWCVLCQNKRK